MTQRARAYRATHHPDGEFDAVMPEFHRVAQRHGTLTSREAQQELADAVHLPIAAVRGACSTYDDAKADPRTLRVCAGTSCMLAGSGALAKSLGGKCHGVYCLGYCDRSPVAMTALGKVAPGLTPAALDALARNHDFPHPKPAFSRCTARHAIVTARLIADHDPRGPAPDYRGLRAALKLSPDAVIAAILAAGLKGRGGAAFPTGKKWQFAAAAHGAPKFIVANGDEGDPGSFIDRELMERDPHSIIEGMAIGAHAVGASRGIVFIRAEYPVASDIMTAAIDQARRAGFVGPSALGPGKPFEMEVIRGMGSYVCGEETALLAAIEGQRGEVWPRPPFPVNAGLYGKPTVVDNVETLNNVPWILEHGPQPFAAMGTPDSKGTKALCFDHGFNLPGIVEVEFGLSLKDAIALAGGPKTELEAVLLGGPMGSIVTPDQFDAPVCFTAMAKRGINLGHGGLVAIPKGTDWSNLLRHLLTFMRDESCGKCVPCRLGSLRSHELAKAGLSPDNLGEFKGLMDLMSEASLCAFGRETPGPIKTILARFSDRILDKGGPR